MTVFNIISLLSADFRRKFVTRHFSRI